ncbi:MAG: hypothetical protein ABI742_01310 [Gemmatimonadota bacterium]
MNRKHLLLAAALITGAAACSDSTGGGSITRPAADLNYVHLAFTAPAPCADSVGAWFVRRTSGSDQELALEFPKSGIPADCTNGGETEDFIRLKLDRASLAQLPNGTPIAIGDSVFISIIWAQGDSVLFEMRPTGLIFSPANPAELKISFGETDEASDSTIVNQLSVWRQAQPADSFVKLATTKLDAEQELEVKLNGFSRYAIAY